MASIEEPRLSDDDAEQDQSQAQGQAQGGATSVSSDEDETGDDRNQDDDDDEDDEEVDDEDDDMGFYHRGNRWRPLVVARRTTGSVTSVPTKDKLLELPSGASYITNERYTVDTRDHEDHTFNGVMFAVEARPLLPIEVVEIKSIAVRGALGPLTVWVADGSFEDKFDDAEIWNQVYKATHAPSFDDLVELPFDVPIHVTPGNQVSLYVHSALPNDQGIVYDNQRSEVTHADRFIQVLPGIAHLSNVPFDSLGHWGWGAWRRRREFVGRLNYGVKYVLWNPEPKIFSLFPSAFKSMCVTVLLCHSRRDSPLSCLPTEIIFYLLNMCPYDWPGEVSDAEVGIAARLTD